MNDNMKVYQQVRAVPNDALKAIQAGRLKGMSDINPMWRLKMLTELFGMCGIGWKTEITDKRLEHGAGDEIACFVEINLYVKVDGEWSAAIPGMGGSSFVAQERNGLHTSDECFKMAYTDAISVACKSLGFAADVYYANDRTKYSSNEDIKPSQPVQGTYSRPEIVPNNNTNKPAETPVQPTEHPKPTVSGDKASEAQIKAIKSMQTRKKLSDEEYRSILKAKFNLESSTELSKKQASEMISYLQSA